MWQLFLWHLVLVDFVWSIRVSVGGMVVLCAEQCLGLCVWIVL